MIFIPCVQQCEDLEDSESLRHMYIIIRGAIMLNDANLLDLLLSEENVMDVVRLIPCHVSCACHRARAGSSLLEEMRIAQQLSETLLASSSKMLSSDHPLCVHWRLRFHGEESTGLSCAEPQHPPKAAA